MAITRETLQRLSFLRRGEVLIGFVHLAAGIIVAREGFLKLQELWLQLQPYLPLSLQAQISEKILTSLPTILKTFVTVVGSICAVLVGLLWIFSGLYNMVQRREDLPGAPYLGQPELVAEWLGSGKPVYVPHHGWFAPVLAKVWPKLRFVSPVSREVIREVLRSLGKIALIWLLIALIVYFLGLVPNLLRKYAQVRIHFLIPSAAPLYALLGLLAFFNCLIALSLVPLKRREFSRGYEAIHVRGKGEAELFFTLLEESCRLLDRLPASEKRTARLEQADDPLTKATLIESSPESVRALARPAAYMCLPVAFLLLTMGFSRLIHFARPVFPMSYAEFLSYHALDYVLEVAFAVGLIAAGAYFLEWARRLFDIRVFRSALVFCRIQPATVPETSATGADTGSGTFSATPAGRWKISQGVGERFAIWATAPQSTGEFRMELFWADALSESAGTAEPRSLFDLQISEALDTSMRYIIELPFASCFQRTSFEERGAPKDVSPSLVSPGV